MLRKILVVDDDPADIWGVGREGIRERGYSIKHFSVPRKAHKYMEENADYDGAIFDVKFEGCNSLNYSVFDLVNFSKAYNPQAPIIVFTGYNNKNSSSGKGLTPGVLSWITRSDGILEVLKTFDNYFSLHP
jgi:CheY-like chemotaxis protein